MNASSDPMKHLHDARLRFGRSRFELGALLEHARRTEQWKGRAGSFSEFLHDLCVNETAAYQYMRVARRFFFELKLADDVLNALALANMSTLDLAARVATEHNIAHIVETVCSLHERDARCVLEALLEESATEPSERPQKERRVAKLVREYWALPDDQRIDVRNALRMPL